MCVRQGAREGKLFSVQEIYADQGMEGICFALNVNPQISLTLNNKVIIQNLKYCQLLQQHNQL